MTASLAPPHLVKYMGSKSNIIEFILENIELVNEKNKKVYDLFSGTCIVAAHLSKKYDVVINDIQEYSGILGRAYLNKINIENFNLALFLDEVDSYVKYFKEKYGLNFFYDLSISIDDYLLIEQQEKNLIEKFFNDDDHYLFVRNYSGTYWSFEQCIYIDSIYRITQQYRSTPMYELLLGALMFAMSYCSQSTGHFAQYRDVKDEKNFADILTYRLKSLPILFEQKLQQLLKYDRSTNNGFESYSYDFKSMLDYSDQRSVIYADPPYANVHYSRFYHVLETLVKYDYPKIEYKGRYRNDRHQSPFSKKSEASQAFFDMFNIIKEKQSTLVLSYSNGGVVELEELLILAKKVFGEDYFVSVKEKDYLHSRLGRTGDRSISVSEVLIIAESKR